MFHAMTWTRGPGDASAVQGTKCSPTAPTDKQGFVFNSTTGLWTPGPVNAAEIQGVAVDAAAPTDGQVIAYSAGTGTYAPTTRAAGPTLYAIDASDRIVWTFSESTGTYVNTGGAGAYPATTRAGTPIGNQLGQVTRCVFLNGVVRVGGADSAASKVAVNAVTIAGWVRRVTGIVTWVGYKRYRTTGINSGWTTPFVTIGLVINADNTLTGDVTIGANGVGTLYNATSPAVASYGTWMHVGCTFNSAEGIFRFYVNGVLVYTSGVLATGNLDWNTGDPGGWNIGADPNSGEPPIAHYNALRVCNVVRDAAWFSNVYLSESGHIS